MALHKDFPKDPYVILDPSIRWFPADETLREKGGIQKLLPPLVADLRLKVKDWRDKHYEGASDTSKALLNWWFNEEHIIYDKNGIASTFRYYFAQREALETVIWLFEVAKVKDKYDLIRYNSTGVLSAGMFGEDWLRFVTKMATGAGKTKVMSLMIAWAYFHKKYEQDSRLAKNFLLITPNVIVFERIKSDFEGLKIFFTDPVLPDNGYRGQNWQDDFQMTLHLQDDLRTVSDTGNIFLTNIHRVFEEKIQEASLNDEDTSAYFLGHKPVTKTNDSTVDLGMIVRDIDELIVINDEAHHIHDEDMAWYKSILDIDNRLKQKGSGLALELDVTATPKKNDGSIFVQTITDYPLVEAIHQRIVKNPVVPDAASRGKLKENQSALFSEKYRDYINLGIEEWRKTYDALKPMGKKSILFIMTDDTKNCDEVAEYIETSFADLRNAVLTIHTNKSGEISESVTGKNKEELDLLRTQANRIDSWESPFKVIISVMMLKEGWDVKNVTTIVGLRPYAADSKILPEQTLGRGLRRMFPGLDAEEYVSVIGTRAFMEFVESINEEGVILENKSMGKGSKPIAPTVIEVDRDNPHKNIKKLDIELPVMTPRIQREYKNLASLNVSKFGNKRVKVKVFTEEEKREIVFKDVVDEKTHHTTILMGEIEPDYRSVIGFFAQAVMRELRLFGCYDILFGKVKEFIQNHMFDTSIDLSDLNVLRNLSEVEYIRLIKDSFKKAINELTVQDSGDTEIKNYIKISEARPFVVNDKAYLLPKKSVFNKIVGDSDFELTFAEFLENCDDVVSFSKNFQNKEASALRIEYKNSEGFIATYYPDFFIKKNDKTVYIVETKGREEDDDKLKFDRLQKWCEDVNNRQSRVEYKALYIKQENWERYTPKSFDEAIRLFNK